MPEIKETVTFTEEKDGFKASLDVKIRPDGSKVFEHIVLGDAPEGKYIWNGNDIDDYILKANRAITAATKIKEYCQEKDIILVKEEKSLKDG